ncbi:hypothetical protein BSKO_07011 [Bryopsis sp. KO-2023]|nr:hypothetical protein BSKO_07011 [Bryopsis sp. KO-2023]
MSSMGQQELLVTSVGPLALLHQHQAVLQNVLVNDPAGDVIRKQLQEGFELGTAETQMTGGDGGISNVGNALKEGNGGGEGCESGWLGTPTNIIHWGRNYLSIVIDLAFLSLAISGMLFQKRILWLKILLMLQSHCYPLPAFP